MISLLTGLLKNKSKICSLMDCMLVTFPQMTCQSGTSDGVGRSDLLHRSNVDHVTTATLAGCCLKSEDMDYGYAKGGTEQGGVTIASAQD